ncbi:hypothetical protein ACS0TY_030824 [Phlomoides rotata]
MIECSVCHSHSKLVSPSTKAVSRAYDQHRSKVSSKQRVLNFLLVGSDCVLVGLQPVLVFMSKVDDRFKFSPIRVNFLTGIAKVFFAITMLIFQAKRQKVGEKPILSISTFIQITHGAGISLDQVSTSLIFVAIRFLFYVSCLDYKYYEYRLSEEEKALGQPRDSETSQMGFPEDAGNLIHFEVPQWWLVCSAVLWVPAPGRRRLWVFRVCLVLISGCSSLFGVAFKWMQIKDF